MKFASLNTENKVGNVIENIMNQASKLDQFVYTTAEVNMAFYLVSKQVRLISNMSYAFYLEQTDPKLTGGGHYPGGG